MKRTNIYLEEDQAEALDELARCKGVSRAEIIRRMIDEALSAGQTDDLAADLAAIHDSFGVLRDADDSDFIPRVPDERSRHLDRMWQL
jgi:hypothetical protein